MCAAPSVEVGAVDLRRFVCTRSCIAPVRTLLPASTLCIKFPSFTAVQLITCSGFSHLRVYHRWFMPTMAAQRLHPLILHRKSSSPLRMAAPTKRLLEFCVGQQGFVRQQSIRQSKVPIASTSGTCEHFPRPMLSGTQTEATIMLAEQTDVIELSGTSESSSVLVIVTQRRRFMGEQVSGNQYA